VGDVEKVARDAPTPLPSPGYDPISFEVFSFRKESPGIP